MSHQMGRAQPTGSPERRRTCPRLRLVVLGATAVVLVWTGHGVTWALLGRAGLIWLLDGASVLAGIAVLAVLLRTAAHRWLMVAVVASLLVALLR